MRSRISLAVGVYVAGVSMLVAGCSANVEGQAPAPGRPGGGGGAPPVPVATASVETRAMPVTLGGIGTAEPYTSVAVRAQITGTLTSVGFTEGEDVKAGQTLFSLDRRPLEAALAQSEAALKRDTAQSANAQASAGRYQDLLSRGIVSREQADQSRTTAAALDATRQADQAAVDNASVQLQYATIASPISGRTGSLIVHEGNLVRANDTTPLVVINQVSPIFVSFGIAEAQLAQLRRYVGQGAIKVEAMPTGETAPSVGRVSFIDNAVDPSTGQIKVKAVFGNEDHRLWPGQFANVTLTLSTDKNAVVVPTAAVQTSQQGTYVFVVKPDHTVELRPITVQRQVDDVTVVSVGVKPGDQVVTDGQLRLVPGARVTVKGAVQQTASREAQ